MTPDPNKRESLKPYRQMPYAFIRADGFYPIDLKDDEEARRNAECNPGTLRVINAITGKTVWQAEPAQ